MRSITSLGLLFGGFFAVSCLGQRMLCLRLLAQPPLTLASQRNDAENFEKEGKISEAKKARLALAKATLERRGIAWPLELSDAVAREVIWDAHTRSRKRRPGISGAVSFFRPRLESLRKHFSPLATMELLRSGVAGDDAAFLNGIGTSPGSPTPKLVYADYLAEGGRHSAEQFLRLAVERERLIASGDPADRARIAAIEGETDPTTRLARAAVYDWFDTDVGEALTAAGMFTMDPQSGLPLFRPRHLEALLALDQTVLDTIVALDLTGFPFEEPRSLQRLNATALPHVQTLHIGGATAAAVRRQFGRWIVTSLPALRSLTMTAEPWGPYDSNETAVNVAQGMHGGTLPHLFELRLRPNGGQSTYFAELPQVNAPNLVHIDVRGPLSGANEFRTLHTPALKTLSLVRSRLNTELCIRMAHWDLPALRSLDVSHSMIWGDLRWSNWRLQQLEEINFDGNVLDRDSMRSLAACNLPKLRRLSLVDAFDLAGEEQITTLTEELERGALRRLREVAGPEETVEWKALRALLQSRP